jgi:starch synthase
LAEQVRRVVGAFHDKPLWHALIQNGMRRDFSWRHSAADYVAAYRRASSRRSGGPPPIATPPLAAVHA